MALLLAACASPAGLAPRARPVPATGLHAAKTLAGAYLSVPSAQTQVLAQQRLQADLRAREIDDRIDLVRSLGGGFKDESSSARKPS